MLDLATALKRRELVVNLAVRTLKVRYKNSALGFLWTLINPLLMMLIYWVFISILAKVPTPMPVLLVGVIFWQFIVMCTGDAAGAVAGHANLVKKVYFPRVLMPFSMCLANFVNYLLSLAVLFVLVIVISLSTGFQLDLAWLWLLPFALVLQFALVFGIALIVSALNVYFRDIEHITSVVLMALFFMSPILYPLDLVRKHSGPVQTHWYTMNPLASLVTLMRRAFLGASTPWPGEWTFVPSLALSLVVLAFGLWLFSRLEPDFADQL